MPMLEIQPMKKSRYSKILDLQLQGFQINLKSRPNPRSDRVTAKHSPRINKFRPKRPMSAIPAIGYQKSDNSKIMPSWSRPQSAGSTRRNKLAAKFSGQDSQESGYNSELGATYTLSSSRMLQSLMGSCSINAGLDTDSSHTPSPQPSLGETIRAAAHLEPGLASKPPLPPTTNKDNENIDDIIAFKFQRWFPDSVVKMDKTKSLLDLRPYENKYNNEEITDESDFGSRISLTDGEISDRDIKYMQKDDYQTGKIKKHKQRPNSPLKCEEKNKHTKSLNVKDFDKNSGLKSPCIVVTEESVIVEDKINISSVYLDYKPSVSVSKQVDEERKGREISSSLFCDSLHKINIDNSSFKPKNHSPPIKLTSENGKGHICGDNSPRIPLDEISDPKQMPKSSLKQYSESYGEKINVNNDENHIKQNDLFSFHNMSPENSESQVLDSFSKNNCKSSSLGNNSKQSESLNNDAILQTVNKSKSRNRTGDIASTANTDNKKLLRSASCDSSVTLKSQNGIGEASYADIISILKVLETEDLEPPLLKSVVSSPVKTMPSSSSARAILNFLDEVDKNTNVESPPLPDAAEVVNAAVSSSRFGELLNMNSADLAQTVMKLTLQLEEVTANHEVLQKKHKHTMDLMKQQKEQEEVAVRKNQKFIDQILAEKRQLAEQCEKIVKEMEEKHLNNIRNMDERHKVEIKKAQERFATAEKSRRDRWIDLKTKKIKEMTVKGLEPELDRMSRVHQEEISELRRVHQKQIEEIDTAWSRRLATQREQDLAEKEIALTHEREATRHRLELEVGELEKSYQEQRKRMLDEVRRERDAMERDVQSMMEQKQIEMEKEWQQMQQRLIDKMKEQEIQYQEEIKKVKGVLETEKEAWISRQNAELLEKEAVMKQELKRERDRHIEMIIRKLETEATAKEQAIDNKIKRLKETYESEIKELEGSLKELKVRLKEARVDVQKCEDNLSQTTNVLHQAQTECIRLKQTCDQLEEEKCAIMSQNETKVLALQKELSSLSLSLQQEISTVHEEKEKQLQQVYTRVKEAVTKKDEAVIAMQKQRDAALEQCCHLEKLLEQQRKNILQLKSDKEQL